MLKKLLPFLLAGLAFLLVFALLRPAPQTQALVALGELPAGHVLVDADIELKSIPEDLLPEDYLSDPALAVGQALRVDRSAGDVLAASQLGAELVLLQPNERAIAITVRDSSGLGGLLKTGDLVGVTAIISDLGGVGQSGTFSKATVENLRVLYITPSFLALDPAEATGSVVTPDPETGIAVERERTDEGVVVLAVPINGMAVTYDFTASGHESQSRLVNAIELLAALDAADTATLSLYLMPKDAEGMNTSGLWLPSLLITPGATLEPTATVSPAQVMTAVAPTAVPQP